MGVGPVRSTDFGAFLHPDPGPRAGQRGSGLGPEAPPRPSSQTRPWPRVSVQSLSSPTSPDVRVCFSPILAPNPSPPPRGSGPFVPVSDSWLLPPGLRPRVTPGTRVLRQRSSLQEEPSGVRLFRGPARPTSFLYPRPWLQRAPGVSGGETCSVGKSPTSLRPNVFLSPRGHCVSGLATQGEG